MIVCKKCGHRNSEGETFCASCGSFLEWNSEKITEPEPAAPLAAAAPSPPAPEQQSRALSSQSATVVPEQVPTAPAPSAERNGRGELICGTCGVANPSSRRFCRRCGSSLIEPDVVERKGAEMPWWRRIFSTRGKPIVSRKGPAAAAEQNPSKAPDPAASDRSSERDAFVEARLPQAVLPEKSRPRTTPRPKPRPGERYNPGDLICGQCGIGNTPSRRFCRRCGASLVEAAVVATPWWRRIFPARRAAPAGTRPGAVRRTVDGSRFASGAKLLAKTLIALILLGAVAGLAALPDTRTTLANRAAAAVKDFRRAYFVGEFVHVRPESAKASSEVIGHQAQFLLDPNAGYWAADTTQDAQPTATLNFAQPTDLDYVVVTSGAGPDFAKMGRPRKLRVTYSPSGFSEDVTLSDDPKPVRYHLHGNQASAIRLQIVQVYPTAQSSLVAISELDLFKLK